MRGFIVVFVLGLASAAMTSAPIPKSMKASSTVASSVLGQWKLKRGDQGKVSYEFTITYEAGGVLKFDRVYGGNRQITDTGSYTTAEPTKDDPLGSITWSIKQFNRERGEKSVIKKLTATELTFVDPDGLVEEFERVEK